MGVHAGGRGPGHLSRVTRFLGGFSPASLFAASEPGAWYDPSDLTTMFQDSAGTTPVTATGQTVGRILDKSGRGNHATQSVLASRPIYGIEPLGGRRNFARYTQQFDNAAWAGANTGGTGVAPVITPDAALAPDGTMTADRIVFSLGGGTTTADVSRRRQTTTAADGISGTGTFSFWARTTDGVSSVNLLRESSDGFAGNQITVTGSWQRFAITSATYTAGSSIGLGLRGGQTPAMPNTADILVWGAQLETGSTATAYQRVTDQWNVTEAGVPSVSYLAFDGTDDFLVTPTITPGTNKVQVFAGVRKLSDAATGVVAETSASIGANNGAFVLSAPDSPATNLLGFASRGTATRAAQATSTFSAPVTVVQTGIGDIAADTSVLRVNGSGVASNTGDQGTGNYLAYPLYIGRRGGTSLPLNGRIYSLIVRFGANLTADQISQTETWVNSKTGAY